MLKKIIGIYLLTVLLSTAAIADSRQVFEQHESAVMQIRVINLETGKKTSIGSGFIVHQGRHLASNFHVVSDYVDEPDRFRLEYINNQGGRGDLKLIDIDVVHDLALLSTTEHLGQAIQIAPTPAKGETIYAMGNPHDLGLTIAVGTNGGVLNQTDDSRILFSGSLNPGMSGGPTFDEQGQLVGINVATARNDISFIVPANYLEQLIENAKARNFSELDNFKKAIGLQLANKQKDYLRGITQAGWADTQIKSFRLPSAISPTIRCWDDSPKLLSEQRYKRFSIRCKNENSIYLNSRIDVGKIVFEYLWLESDQLNPVTFSRLYQRLNSSQITSRAKKQDVSLFNCNTHFVNIAGKPFKTTLCRRDYVEHPELSDLIFTAAMVGQGKRGFIFNFDLIGTHHESAIGLLKRLLEEMKWQP